MQILSVYEEEIISTGDLGIFVEISDHGMLYYPSLEQFAIAKIDFSSQFFTSPIFAWGREGNSKILTPFNKLISISSAYNGDYYIGESDGETHNIWQYTSTGEPLHRFSPSEAPVDMDIKGGGNTTLSLEKDLYIANEDNVTGFPLVVSQNHAIESEILGNCYG